ncbi:MAG: ATP synthase subunit I [Gammaproteobacteria bacterium]|nr:ATP synthase subunit I [Gammaproteobacteria bacterium]MCD8524288.1 ATP synthase subunit I [Gammaproteobacteria bacterium]
MRAFFFLLTTGVRSGLSVLAGGLVYILPAYLYALCLFSNVSPQKIMRIMCIFYLGEVLKLLLSISLFLVLWRFFMLPLLPYFIGYGVSVISFFVGSMMLMSKTMVNKIV